MTHRPVAEPLGDFTANARVLTLTLIAGVVGTVSAFVALALVRLIGFFTHLFYYHEIAGSLVWPANHRLGPVASCGISGRSCAEPRTHDVPPAGTFWHNLGGR